MIELKDFEESTRNSYFRYKGKVFLDGVDINKRFEIETPMRVSKEYILEMVKKELQKHGHNGKT